MTNNLIKNETKVFYTVQVKEGLFVRRTEFSSGRVINLHVTTNHDDSSVYDNQKTAIKVAMYVGGKIIKHTTTHLITEVTEEIHVIKEEQVNA